MSGVVIAICQMTQLVGPSFSFTRFLAPSAWINLARGGVTNSPSYHQFQFANAEKELSLVS